MLVRILVDGESPDVGPLVKGAERIICPEALARIFIARGIAEEIKPKEAIKPKKEKEANHG